MWGSFSFDRCRVCAQEAAYLILHARATSFNAVHIDEKLSASCGRCAVSRVRALRPIARASAGPAHVTVARDVCTVARPRRPQRHGRLLLHLRVRTTGSWYPTTGPRARDPTAGPKVRSHPCPRTLLHHRHRHRHAHRHPVSARPMPASALPSPTPSPSATAEHHRRAPTPCHGHERAGKTRGGFYVCKLSMYMHTCVHYGTVVCQV